MSSASSIDVVTQLMAEPSSKLPVNYAGALMIIFFHQTSVREFTGWSTMTGRICSERFEVCCCAEILLTPSADTQITPCHGDIGGRGPSPITHLIRCDISLRKLAHEHDRTASVVPASHQWPCGGLSRCRSSRSVSDHWISPRFR